MSLLLVPDTNIFVQFQYFNGFPWREVSGREDIVVVVLAAVISELDKLKLEPRLRDRVRDVLPRLEELFADGDTATLQDGTPARFEHGTGLRQIMEDHGLELRLGDDRILAAVLKLQQAGSEVAVVSDDTAVRLRCRGLGISARAVPEKYRRPSADPLQAENAKLRREVHELKNAVPSLEVHFAEGSSPLRVVRQKPPSRSRRRLEDVHMLSRLDLRNLPAAYGMELEKPTQAEVDIYNKRLEAFRPTYEKYLSEREAFELFPHQSIALELLIRNTGGKPAEGIKLLLRMPEGVLIIPQEQAPEKPVPPVGPKLPGRPRGMYASVEDYDRPTDLGARRKLLEVFDLLPAIPASVGPSNVTGPDFSQGELSFGIGMLSNFDEEALPRCFVKFPTPEAVRSFGLNYTLRSHSLPKLVEGEIHITVSTEQGTAGTDRGQGE